MNLTKEIKLFSQHGNHCKKRVINYKEKCTCNFNSLISHSRKLENRIHDLEEFAATVHSQLSDKRVLSLIERIFVDQAEKLLKSKSK